MDPSNIAKYDMDLTKEEERANAAIHELLKAAIPRRPTEERSVQPSKTYRINDSLKPSVLSKDASPVEMRHWLDSFKAYYTSNNMETFSKSERLSYFKILLDCDLKTRITSKMDDSTDIFGKDGCLEILERDFLCRYPLFSRRLDFFQKQQKAGQPFTDYMARLKELSKLADLEKLSVEEIFVFCALRGTTDKDLLDDFLELPEKTLKAIEDTASLYESKLYSKAKLSAPVDTASPVLKVYPPPTKRQGFRGGNPKRDRPNANAKAPTDAKRPSSVREMRDRGLCTRCGRNNHNTSGCSYDRSVVCNNCGIKGHIAPACMGRKINVIGQGNDRGGSRSRESSPSESSCTSD
ncbi:zinc knuckle [Paramuricea clavata]|uniref:Zinc knuckle n=1 Tax=Paramuricea clavata TaxID=317549 RepID=A0A6S7KM72_PARCT|nr:zinc knuckle [Paramuricea clavata]